MKVIEKGHVYEVKGSNKTSEMIHFVKKAPSTPKPGSKLEVVSDGTTNEEVLAVLIDRMKHLNEMKPCSENRQVIKHLEQSLILLNRRTADRKARRVEGTSKD